MCSERSSDKEKGKNQKKLKKPKKNKEQKKAEFEAEERTKKNTRREEEACTKSKRGSGLAHLEQMLGRKLLDRERAEVEETNAALERAGWEWHVTDIYKKKKRRGQPTNWIQNQCKAGCKSPRHPLLP